MKRRIQIHNIVFFALLALMIVIIVISLAGAISWLNRPFAGFLVYKDLYVSVSGQTDWPGPEAGLKFRDRIVAIDGQQVQEGNQFVNIIKEKQPGTPVRYSIDTDGQKREVEIKVDKFGIGDFIIVFLVSFLIGFMLYILGFVVYVLKPNTPSSWVFLMLCFSLGSMMISGFEQQSSYFSTRLFDVVNILYPATWLHLFLIFPERKRFLDRLPAIEYLLYVPFFLLIVANEIYWSIFQKMLSSDLYAWFPTYRTLGSINRIFTLLCVLFMIILIFHTRFKAASLQARQRARVIFWGVTVAFGPPVFVMTLGFFLKYNLPWNFLAVFVIFFPASIAYSIVRHNLFDADEIIKRTVGYIVVTGIVVGMYALVSVGLNFFLGQYQVAQSKAFPILFTIGVILVFNPLRDRIQALVDRIFFRKEYDYGAIVERVGGAMTSLLELPQILKHLSQTFIEDMFISTSSVMLLSSTGAEYQISLADGERKEEVEKKVFKRDDPLIEIIEAEKKELTKYDVIEDPKFKEVSEPCAANFEALHASLMVPLVYQDKVIGSLNLGEKKSGKPFNREDIELLRTLAHQGAVAIENARLFEENLEKQRMEEELNIARDLQMSMLPAESPEIQGFNIASYSVSAREVGGDFYDFIDMGEEKAGFVIGDVTGKERFRRPGHVRIPQCVPHAVGRRIGVSESMMRANRRLKKDVKSGMFVALLFAVLDSRDRTVTLCSAGQTQPIHLSAKTGEANLVETEGDTFPLGILDEANYEETKIQLSSGDRVLFYTDGIVEAMNEKEEMYGFERLQEVVQKSKSMDADALLKEILEKVNEFVGGAPQHDDLTLIVVGVE